MQPSCLRDNRNFTVFAEPCGMYFTYFPLVDEGAGEPLPHALLLIIGCLHNVSFLIIWVNRSSPHGHIDFLLSGRANKEGFLQK